MSIEDDHARGTALGQHVARFGPMVTATALLWIGRELARAVAEGTNADRAQVLEVLSGIIASPEVEMVEEWLREQADE